MTIDLGDNQGRLVQCKTAKGVWKVMVGTKVMVYLVVYVDGAMINTATETILAVVKAFQGQLACKIMGINVTDGVLADMCVPCLTFLYITI